MGDKHSILETVSLQHILSISWKLIFFRREKEEIPCWHVDKDKLSETEKIVFTAISSITTSLRTGAKDYSSQLNSKDWFSFMKSLVQDKTFCMKEEQKTRSFILFQNKFLKESGSSSFRDFVLQLTGIFEYTGFITCIDLALEKLEYLRTATDEYGLLYSDAWYKTSFDFIETSLKKIKDKALETKESKDHCWLDYVESPCTTRQFRFKSIKQFGTTYC